MTNKLFPSLDERDIDDLECALSCGIMPTHISDIEWNELLKKYGHDSVLDFGYAKFVKGDVVCKINGQLIYKFVKA